MQAETSSKSGAIQDSVWVFIICLVRLNQGCLVAEHFAFVERSPAAAIGEGDCDANISRRGAKRIAGVSKGRISRLVHHCGVSDIIAADFDPILVISRRTQIPVDGGVSQRMAGSQIHAPPLGIAAAARAPSCGEAAIIAIRGTIAVLSRTCRDRLALR